MKMRRIASTADKPRAFELDTDTGRRREQHGNRERSPGLVVLWAVVLVQTHGGGLVASNIPVALRLAHRQRHLVSASAGRARAPECAGGHLARRPTERRRPSARAASAERVPNDEAARITLGDPAGERRDNALGRPRRLPPDCRARHEHEHGRRALPNMDDGWMETSGLVSGALPAAPRAGTDEHLAVLERRRRQDRSDPSTLCRIGIHSSCAARSLAGAQCLVLVLPLVCPRQRSAPSWNNEF